MSAAPVGAARVPADRRRRKLLRAALVVALALFAMEAAVRVLASSSPALRRLADPGRGWRREPADFDDLQRAFADHLVPYRPWFGARCNSLGFHDEELRAVLPAGSHRLVALGDSFAFGNVPWARAYLTMAEAALRLLGDVGPGRAVSELVVDNLGVPATGIETYRRIYEIVGRALSPDTVLVTVYLGNDTIDISDAARFGGRAPGPRSWLWTALVRGFAVERELAREGVLRAAGATAPADGEEIPPVGAAPVPGRRRHWSDDRPPLSQPVFSAERFADVLAVELSGLLRPGAAGTVVAWAEVERALEEVVAAIESDAARPVVVLAPSRLQIYAAELEAAAQRAGRPPSDYDALLPNRRLAAWARSRGVALVDLTPALAAAARDGGERLYLVNDTHWNLRGNGIAGLTLAQRLVELGVVPPRPTGGPGEDRRDTGEPERPGRVAQVRPSWRSAS